ncbi:MAG: hypothetical protein U0X73_03030 [Thermoanaerobaculia bacterium]
MGRWRDRLVLAPWILWAAAGTFAGGIVLPLFWWGSFVLGSAPWNFPGDPPSYEALIYFASLAGVINLPLWLLLRKAPSDSARGQIVVLARSFTIFALATIQLAGLGLLERHSPRWAGLRAAMMACSDDLAAAQGGGHSPLTDGQVDRWRQAHRQKPLTAHLPGFGEVRLDIGSDEYPYCVKTDFGEGHIAVFDFATMWCTYSD